MAPLHRYQRGVLLSFILSLVVFVLYVAAVPNKFSSTVEMYCGITWLIAYTSFCLILRSKISDNARVNGLKRPFIHWIILGLMMIYFNIVRPSDFQFLYPIINIGFVIFTLFSTDSHWDFRTNSK